MKIAAIIVGSILLLLLIFCFFAANYIVKRIVFPKRSSRIERQERNKNEGLLTGTENYQREETSFVMPDGYVINGDISLKDPKKFVIFAHGHGSTREGAIKYTQNFYELGYSIVLYDERGAGDNEPAASTMGYKEAQDLKEIISQIRSKYGDVEIGLFGYSMGGATVCLCSKYCQKEVKFIISDCSYSSLKYECFGQCIMHNIIPYPTIWFINLLFKAKYHFSFKDCEISKAVSANHLPICFFHGSADKRVLPKNAERLFNASISKIKKLHIMKTQVIQNVLKNILIYINKTLKTSSKV